MIRVYTHRAEKKKKYLRRHTRDGKKTTAWETRTNTLIKLWFWTLLLVLLVLLLLVQWSNDSLTKYRQLTRMPKMAQSINIHYSLSVVSKDFFFLLAPVSATVFYSLSSHIFLFLNDIFLSSFFFPIQAKFTLIWLKQKQLTVQLFELDETMKYSHLFFIQIIINHTHLD